MIKKDEVYRWDKREKDAFSHIKQAITEARALYSPYFSFLLYTFASDTSLLVVLMQKDDQDNEQPIYFMSDSLQGLELNYLAIDKQSYAIYKAMKHLWPYLLKNHCIIFVMHPKVRSLFVQQELGERRVN